MAISVSFLFSWAAQPGAWGPASLGAGFLYRILFLTGLVSKLFNRGPEGSLCWVIAFSTAFCHQRVWSPNSLVSKLPVFLSSLSYIIVQRPLNLWNGMFDRHRAEITVMQFTGHSLPVHQFVTVPWDFNPVPYCQPCSPTPMEYALTPSLEWHVWPGRRSIYNSIRCHWPVIRRN